MKKPDIENIVPVLCESSLNYCGNGYNMVAVSPKILNIAQQMAYEMAANGAKAALLMGSHVRGDSHPESDIDLTFIGRDEECKMERRNEHLVSVYWRSLESIKNSLREPSVVGGLVPALRSAVIIYDPYGIVTQLKQEVEAWTWDTISDQCDSWVAEQIASYTEEVHRLIGSLKLGRVMMAAVVRCVLSTRIAMVLSVHLRLFYDTENRLWDLVNEAMGDHWTRVQAIAFGIGKESFKETCEAALELYTIAASKVKHLLNDRQYKVVAYACTITGHPI